ncbi:DUF742 domain-containing protein [Streptomyces sp. NPDC059850]|uniref:DUF742 domain-containing protein n=1 Tax=Streptomyces sp. NPDC059850 TaxID=3346970 RepID=UPI003663EBF3
MMRWDVHEEPDRLFAATGGRSRAYTEFDLVSLVVSESEPAAGMAPETVQILRLCRHPMALVEVSARLRMPVGVVAILLSDLLAEGRISVRHPSSGAAPREASPRAASSRGADAAPEPAPARLPDTGLVREVLVALKNL